MPKRELSLKQTKWLEAYLRTGNATEAARQAGYEGSDEVLASIGWENLRKLEIKKRVEARLAESQVSANEVIGTLVSQMRADITEILTPGGHLDIEMIRGKSLGHLLRKIKTRRYVENRGEDDEVEVEITEVELYDAQAAAAQLCKIFGLYAPTNINVGTLDSEIERELARLGLATEESASGEAEGPARPPTIN